jgi:glutamate synthase (NADPH/NADH) small chain
VTLFSCELPVTLRFREGILERTLPVAKERMLQFVTVSRETPEKRAAAARRDDFGEIYAEFAASKAAEQSGRCSQCGVPYCQSHCPLHNNNPDWLRLTAEGRLQEA